jgi:lysozyme family protein
MEANWPTSLALILKEEGGNDDNPHDPGGRTSRGITQREYDAFRRASGEPLQDVWSASNEEVDKIYRSNYWLPYGPSLPSGVDLCYFNMAVNSGAGEATKLLQRALGVNADGRIGAVTLEAIKEANPIRTVSAFSDECQKFYRSLSGYKYFGKGWLSRTATVEAAALKLAAQEVTV